MPRAKRVVAVGAPHHVTQRGNARQDVFVNDGLRRVYLDLLAEHAGKNSLRVAAYCLMTNHVHLVVVPGFATRTPASRSIGTRRSIGLDICGRTGFTPVRWKKRRSGA